MEGVYLGPDSLKYLWAKAKEEFGRPAGEDVIYTDTETGTKYRLCIQNGAAVFTEVTEGKIAREDVIYTDTETGTKYGLCVQNGMPVFVEK